MTETLIVSAPETPTLVAPNVVAPTVPIPTADAPEVTAPVVPVPKIEVMVGGVPEPETPPPAPPAPAVSASGSEPPAAQPAVPPVSPGPAGEPAASAAGSGPASGLSVPEGDQLMRRLLQDHLKVAALQAGYQAVSRSLPAILAAGIEAGRQKRAADAAFEQGIATAARVLAATRDTAAQLSSSMRSEHETMLRLLSDKDLLGQLSTSASVALAAANTLGQGIGAPPGSETAAAGPANRPPQPQPQGAGQPLTPRGIAVQMNQKMGDIQGIVAQEVERKISGLLGQLAARLEQKRASRG
jgi:hypothetical protein